MPGDTGEFDYVIIGAGSAGCVLAARLSEDKDARVLLLEAGGTDWDPLVKIPVGIGKLHELRLHDWGLSHEPAPHLDGRSLYAARGKLLGGSSSINNMAYVRGHRGDYDRWAAAGCAGWSYADVLPYFRRCEDWEGGADAYRGSGGPIKTQFLSNPDPIIPDWWQACRDAGYPSTDDYNGATTVGFGRAQSTIGNGRRSSAAVGYLRPARSRKNLTVVTRAHATHLLLEKNKVVGVEYESRDQLKTARSRRETLLCGGVFSSPQILMLSGIGPADHLRSIGIEPRIDLPGVGKNLQDHLNVPVFHERLIPGPFRDRMRFDRMAVNMLRAYFFGSGPATVLPGGLHGFLQSVPGLAAPDLQFAFRAVANDAHLWFPGIVKPYGDEISMRTILLHPKSRGEVLLRSANPRDKPRIVHDFLSHPDDMPILRRGVRIIREIFAQKVLDRWRGKELRPGEAISTDGAIDGYIRKTASTTSHPASTCRMGTGDGAVVDSDLRLRGVQGLRVVDASVMPDLVSGNINACVLMIAERASDLIRGRTPLAPATGI